MTFLQFLRVCAASIAMTLASHPAWALEGGSIDSNADPTFASVGSLTLASGGTFSGVLIDARHVLTAQHVVGAGSAPSDWTFNVNLDSLAAADRVFSVTRVVAAPGFTGFGGGAIPRNDLTVLELDRDVPAVIPIYGLSTQALQLGQAITLVGYGGTGADVKKQGTNVVEFVDPTAAPDVFAYDFDTDSANQATVVGGDSGSPVFVQAGGTWKLAGISTFSWTNPEVPGNVARGGGGMIVSAYLPWIEQATAVPEPSTNALLATGMLMLVACVGTRRMRRCAVQRPTLPGKLFAVVQNALTEARGAR